MLAITNEDILLAEKILLPEGKSFDDERRNVIKCLESKDVLACPGSGKTTTLLAKLIAISRHLPIDGDKGICVLTHTNVAVDTIAKGAGLRADKLLEYPNYFGTIQSFVDKYLAIPSYVERYGRRPDKIDKDWYDATMKQYMVRQSRLIGNKTLAYCHKNEKYKNYPYSICFSDFKTSPQNKCPSLSLDLNVPDQKEIYEGLLAFKQRILKTGILSYDDAYYLASHYVNIHSTLRSFFSKRFAYVFIDEMQDTDSEQINLLEKLFDDSVVTQRIGDINQSIFSFTADNECCWDVGAENSLQITGSKRFSNSIASVIKSVCIHPQDLTGNPDIPDIMPTIIAFSDNNIHNVIPRFGDLIFEHNLQGAQDGRFKVVGWISKPHDTKHTLPSYWESYEREIQTKNSEFTNLVSYIVPQNDDFIRLNGVKFYKTAIIRALLKCLRKADKPNDRSLRSETAFFKYLKERDAVFCGSLETKLSKWCMAIHKKKAVLEEISNFIRTEFATFFDVDNTGIWDDFLVDNVVQAGNSKSLPKTNTYTHVLGGDKIDIEISTVHGVKGQTHTATLYLETFYNDYDIKRIMEYLEGGYSPPIQKYVKSNLRVTYVGMSRPSHFLCVAVHKSHLAGQLEKLTTAGWNIDSTLTSE